MKGWIKLDRKIQNNFLWDDSEPFDRRSAWIDLLLLANHKDHEMIYRGEVITVKRGQVNRSILQLAERWRWSRGKVSRYLKILESAKMCAIDSTTDGTTITIENYSKYQDWRATDDTTDDTTDGQPTDNERTANGQRTDTYNNDKERIRMINNDKKEKEDAVMDRLSLLRSKYKKVNQKWKADKPDLWEVEQ